MFAVEAKKKKNYLTKCSKTLIIRYKIPQRATWDNSVDVLQTT